MEGKCASMINGAERSDDLAPYKKHARNADRRFFSRYSRCMRLWESGENDDLATYKEHARNANRRFFSRYSRCMRWAR